MLYSNLVQLMNKNKLSVMELSLKTGVATETITRARGDKISKCKLETLEKMATVLEVKVKDLFYEE